VARKVSENKKGGDFSPPKINVHWARPRSKLRIAQKKEGDDFSPPSIEFWTRLRRTFSLSQISN